MAGLGGKCPGAGRKKGSRNKAVVAREANLDKSGMMPLDFMMEVLRDKTRSFDDRKWAATNAAPYYHGKIAPIDRETGKTAMPSVTVIVER